MIDFALEAERGEGIAPEQAIFQRVSPALPSDRDDDDVRRILGGLPLAIGLGTGSELAPAAFGIAIVGGLAFSQMLTRS